MELLELPTESTLQQSKLSVTEQDIIELFKRFITLQDQFTQLTAYVEKAFDRIHTLENIVHNKVLS
jgi:hypothetical protein